ncbi:TAT-variant-translocated molybdopterin oxidoreductase [Compostibacter hankyongensis]|uniref:TAT-variant-translocated molybdopterin oxidoreductase n=1 Tax=Compostibacter hankyongensis TaxID=1007089 RepID=A0ABP8FDT7_9BACT
MKQKKYWKGLEELQDEAGYEKAMYNEFREELPLGESDAFLSTTTPRRDFLKYLGFSITAATVAASCEIKVRKAIPYLNKPEEITPGIPNYYASSYALDGDYCPIVIKTRDGRPIKIEGNTLSSITGGGTSARVQGSVLSLYDTTRLRYPMADGKETTWAALDKQVAGSLAGGGVVLLTGSILSPSVKQAINEFIARYPGTRHVVNDSVSYAGMLMANEASYGKRALPSYHFENAKCIVSIGADFLGTWLSPVEFAGQYGKARAVSGENPSMSQHFQFEGHVSLTGSNADYRYTHKPSELPAVVLGLYNAVAQTLGRPALSGAPAPTSKRVADGIKKAAKALAASQGAALVVSGSNNTQVQILVNGINDMLGAGGKTIDWNTPVNYRQGVDADMQQLVNDMQSGSVKTLLVYGANPAYDYYEADKFAAALKKVPASVSFNDHLDETTRLCKYAAPDHHYLESWGDAEPKTGYYSLQQPGIAPLFKTRQFLETLLKWSGAAESDPLAYIQNYWKTNIFPQYGNGDWQTWWDQSLQDGVAEPKTAPAFGTAAFAADVNDAAAKLLSATPKSGGVEIVFYEKVGVGTGRHANNPWLQEMPDPVSKCTWDNYLCISPAMAEKLHAVVNRFNEVDFHRPLASVKVNGKELKLPILVLPGMHPEVVAVAVGYGRGGNGLNGDALKTARRNIGPSAAGVGTNVYPWVSYNATSGTFEYSAPKAEVSNTGETYLLAITQSHNSFEGRPIIRETTLKDFIEHPEELQHERKEELGKYGENFRDDATLYFPDVFNHPQGIHWGMSVDLSTCIGCSACTIACQAENNVSVVGKSEVARGHEMHWLRIDRYFAGDPEDPQVVFQPMMCQHCDNAPCENVCPVAATSHSDEGLNQMIYNRCIGTRYCENNCPYKVRRFNWRDWNGADSFADNLWDDPATLEMNESLTRMVLNPDVTVRGRGVMEKCTFCVQRLQDAKLQAKKEDRPVKDGEAQTACQQACPTHAIAFGNVNDKESKVYEIRMKNQRLYGVLEELHTLPNVTYLSKVRNKDPEDLFQEGPQNVL